MKRKTVIAHAIAELEAMVTSGEWAVGARIPSELELAERLGVGRNSIREATRALVHTGVLEARPGDGTYVCATSGLDAALERYLSRSNARSVLEARRGLEREAARLAAERRTDADLALLDEIVERQRRWVVAGDRDRFVQDDVEFHRQVVAASHNPVLVDLLAHLGASLEYSVGVMVDEGAGGELQIHTDLLEAIRRRDSAAAVLASDTLIGNLLGRLDSEVSA